MQEGTIVRIGSGCPYTNDGVHHCEDYCRQCGGAAGLAELQAQGKAACSIGGSKAHSTAHSGIVKEGDVECCGQKRESRFCPDCGRRMPQCPLGDLRKHVELQCEKHKAIYENALKVHKQRLSMGVGDGFVPTKTLLVYQKWQSWLDALDVVLNDTSNPHNGTQ